MMSPFTAASMAAWMLGKSPVPSGLTVYVAAAAVAGQAQAMPIRTIAGLIAALLNGNGCSYLSLPVNHMTIYSL
jgi:hypothetical protein